MATNGTLIAPALVFSLTDGPRALSELGWFYMSRPWLRRQHRGAGRSVLVIPGLGAGDWSTRPLRNLLREVGYDAHACGLGTNIGPTARIINGLDELLISLNNRQGGPVSILGQSLGGYLGAELARRHPGMVDRLITLGSSMTITDLRQTRAGAKYRKYRDQHLPEYEFEKWRQAPRPEVPSTSIYSRSDGIIHWHACRYPDTASTENIEIRGSHLGMAVHPAAVLAVLDRLAVPIDAWHPFTAPSNLRAFFPNARRAA